MENKMATPLRTSFSINEKVVSECNKNTIDFTAEMLVIVFGRRKFEKLLSIGNSSPLYVHKHMKISLAKDPLANS